MPELILASSSPRRKMILEKLPVLFMVIPSEAEIEAEAVETLEHVSVSQEPEAQVQQLALTKARRVAGKVDAGIVIGADTLVVLDGRPFGKPSTPDDARMMLEALSGRMHEVITGFAVLNAETGEHYTEAVTTSVTFRELTPEMIAWYISTGEPFDKAGAYGIQDRGGIFVDAIEGCYYNVVGLPLARVVRALERFGVDIFKSQ